MSTWIAGLGALSRNVGEGIIEGRELRGREEERQLRKQELQIQLATLQERIRAGRLPAVIGTRATPTGGLEVILQDQTTGKISIQNFGGQDLGVLPASIQALLSSLPVDKRAVAEGLWPAYSAIGDVKGFLTAVTKLVTEKGPTLQTLVPDRASPTGWSKVVSGQYGEIFRAASAPPTDYDPYHAAEEKRGEERLDIERKRLALEAERLRKGKAADPRAQAAANVLGQMATQYRSWRQLPSNVVARALSLYQVATGKQYKPATGMLGAVKMSGEDLARLAEDVMAESLGATAEDSGE